MDLEYWYKHTSMLGFRRIIKERLPWYLRLLAHIYVDEKILDRSNNCVRVYYSYKSYAYSNTDKERFCYELRLEDFENIANGNRTITKRS